VEEGGGRSSTRDTPIVAVVVTISGQTSTLLSLVLAQNSLPPRSVSMSPPAALNGRHHQPYQKPKDHRHAKVQLDPHEAPRDRLGDVFKVDGVALDQHADGDDGIERASAGRRRGAAGHGRRAASEASKKIAGRRRGSLYLRSRKEPEPAAQATSAGATGRRRKRKEKKRHNNSFRDTDGVSISEAGHGVPLAGHRQFPAAGNTLDHDVGLLDTSLEELLSRALDQRGDQRHVPARVDDGDTEGRAYKVLSPSAIHPSVHPSTRPCRALLSSPRFSPCRGS